MGEVIHLFTPFGIEVLKKARHEERPVEDPEPCPECGINHRPEHPHEPDSLLYQFRFWQAFGRYPTPGDAIKHCPDDVRAAALLWMSERGIDPDEPTCVERGGL